MKATINWDEETPEPKWPFPCSWEYYTRDNEQKITLAWIPRGGGDEEAVINYYKRIAKKKYGPHTKIEIDDPFGTDDMSLVAVFSKEEEQSFLLYEIDDIEELLLAGPVGTTAHIYRNEFFGFWEIGVEVYDER